MELLIITPIDLLMIFNMIKIYNLPFADDRIRLICYALIGGIGFLSLLYRIYKDHSINGKGIGFAVFIYSMIMTINLWVGEKTEPSDWLNCWMVPAALIGGLCLCKYSCNFSRIINIQNVVIQIVIALYMYNRFFTYQAGAQKLNSIFYVLLLMPFVFCQSNAIIRNILIGEMAFATFISLKRTAVLILAICYIVYIIKQDRDNRKTLIKILGAIAAGTILLLVVQNKFGYNLVGKLSTTLEDGGSGREAIYSELFSKLFTRDFQQVIFGGGLRAVYNLINSTAHNDFFEVIYDFGLVGFIAYLMIYKRLISIYKMMILHDYQFSFSFLSSVIIFVIMSLLSHVLMIPTYMLFICIFWAECIRDFEHSITVSLEDNT